VRHSLYSRDPGWRGGALRGPTGAISEASFPDRNRDNSTRLRESQRESKVEFATEFKTLTGHEPFPWQADLYRCFTQGDVPEVCDIPTGLGKTSVIPIWAIALANSIAVPRRLVYVINRRTVVDQATEEAIRLREQIPFPLAISTLRGEMADNEKWSTDPARPAIIIGTIDMVGSRLLFSGYGDGYKRRPHHAGCSARIV
jgi:CRISPR-associated endonuclease/helicase Cas3